MCGGGFFRIECDAMHELVSGLDECEERLRGVTGTMKGLTPEATGSAPLDKAYADLAGSMGGQIEELGKQVDAILERLKVCVTRYEQMDHAWAQQLGDMLNPSGTSPPLRDSRPSGSDGAGHGDGGTIRDVLDGG